MRLGAGSCRHAHQADDHAVALDAAAFDARILGSALDLLTLARSNTYSPGPARLAPGVRAAGLDRAWRTPGGVFILRPEW